MEPTNEAIQSCHAYAIEQFDSAETNTIFVCGMQPFDADDLMHGVIVTREGLECHHPVEFEYYNNPKATSTWFDGALYICMCLLCGGLLRCQVIC